MTEHSKIPLDRKTPLDSGSSLFERADGAFGFGGLKPKLPPKDLPNPTVRREVQNPPAPLPVEQARMEPVQARPAPAIGEPKAAPSPAAERPVEFTASRQAVNRELLRRNGLIDPDGPVTTLLEEFRIVKRELLGDARESGTANARRILVCSPHPGEGKTYCAINLAISMAAERDIEVLLVDADFAKPSIPGLFGLETSAGLMDCLSDPSLKPESLVIPTDIQGLSVMPAGNRTTRDAEYLASSRTSEVLHRLTQGAPNRIVIFDTPPALAASPAADLAGHVGQALLVVRADVTGQNALEDACQLLSACPDIKLLLNATHFSPSGRTFGSYGGYGAD